MIHPACIQKIIIMVIMEANQINKIKEKRNEGVVKKTRHKEEINATQKSVPESTDNSKRNIQCFKIRYI